MGMTGNRTVIHFWAVWWPDISISRSKSPSMRVQADSSAVTGVSQWPWVPLTEHVLAYSCIGDYPQGLQL